MTKSLWELALGLYALSHVVMQASPVFPAWSWDGEGQKSCSHTYSLEQ